MAGRTPREAVKNFADPIHRAISVLVVGPLIPSGNRVGAEQSLILPGDRPARLHGEHELSLVFRHFYRVVHVPEDPEQGPYKASTTQYIYDVLDERGGRVIGYHWHPGPRSPVTFPHVHLPSGTPYDLPKAHAPTGRVSIEAVVRFLVDELRVKPLRDDDDWRVELDRSEEAFRRYRLWH